MGGNENPRVRVARCADRTSNDLQDTAGALWIASGIITPSGDNAKDRLIAKTQGFGVQTGAGIIMCETTGILSFP